jgi:hypothetical protein
MGVFGRWFGSLVALLVLGCRPDPATAEPAPPPPLVLADQPVVRNGVRLIYSIMLDDIAPADRAAARERAVHVIRARLQLAAIAGHVSFDGDKLVVDLAATPATDPEALERAHQVILPTGHLEVHVAEPGSAFMQALADHVRSDPAAASAQIAATLDRWVTPDGTRITDSLLEAADRRRDGTMQDVRAGRCVGAEFTGTDRVTCRETGRDAIQTYASHLAMLDPRLAVPDDRRIGYEKLRSGSWRTYLLERKVVLTGRSIARATAHEDPDLHRWTVDVELDRAGTATFATATASHVGRKLALELDGVVLAAPVLESAITKGRVLLPLAADDPKSETEARDLAIVLTAGELPGPVCEEVYAKLVDGVAR